MITEVGKGVLSIMTIAAQVLIVFLLVVLCTKKKWAHKLKLWFGERGILFSAITITIAFLGSMFLSNVALYKPCLLCWYQRIVIFPNLIILWVAYFKKHKHVIYYVVPLLVIALLLSGYHWQMQLFPPENPQPCSFDSHCVGRYVYEYAHITIAGMAFTASLVTILFLVFTHKLAVRKKKSK